MTKCSGVFELVADSNEIDNTPVGNTIIDVQEEKQNLSMPSSTQVTATHDSTVHELKTILQRKVLIDVLEWDDTMMPVQTNITYDTYVNGVPERMASYDFPQAIFDAAEIVTQKLSNFQYFKADIEIEIKVNANPFQQGALLLVYNPYFNTLSKFRKNATEFLASLTSCPYQVLNLENSNVVKMKLPFCNMYDMFSLANADHQFGTLLVYPLSKLKSDSQDGIKLNVQVFARFVNPEFKTATNLVMGDESLLQKLARKLGMRLVAQGFETDAQGPVSNIAHFVAKGLSWTARLATHVVDGLSKPVNSIIAANAIQRPGYNVPFHEGSDHSLTLASISDNSINSASARFCSDDEMNLQKVTSKHNIFMRSTISSTDFVPLKKLFQFDVSPYQPTSLANKNYSFGSFAYASSLFQYWRGDINFSLSIIKTIYHSGRFVIVYFPNGQTPPDQLGDLISTNYTYIVDMNDKSQDDSATFEFVIPYVYNLPYLDTVAGTTNNGYVAIYALSNLIFPDTVSGEIDFIIGYNGCDNFELALPFPQVVPGFGEEIKKVLRQSDLVKIVSGILGDESLDFDVTIDGASISKDGVQVMSYASSVLTLTDTNGKPPVVDFDQLDDDLTLPCLVLNGKAYDQGILDTAIDLTDGVLTLTWTIQDVSLVNTDSPQIWYSFDRSVIQTGLESYILNNIKQDSWVANDKEGTSYQLSTGEVIMQGGEGNLIPFINGAEPVLQGRALEQNQKFKYYIFISQGSTTLNTRFQSVAVNGTAIAVTYKNDATWPFDNGSDVDWGYNDVSHERVVAQGFIELVSPDSKSLSNIDNKTTTTDVSCIGESVQSLRAYMKRASIFTTMTSYNISINPFSFINNDDNGVRESAGGTQLWETPRNLVSYLFRFASGSTNYKVFLNESDEVLFVSQGGYVYSAAFGVGRAYSKFSAWINNLAEVRLPYYSRAKCIAVGIENLPKVLSSVVLGKAKTAVSEVLESAGDDTEFWFMIGPPVCKRTYDRSGLPSSTRDRI